MYRIISTIFGFLCLTTSLTACVRDQPRIIVITATFSPGTNIVVQEEQQNPPALSPNEALTNPTPDPVQSVQDLPDSYVVQAGDTLSEIATRFGLSVDSLMEVNNLLNPNLLRVGQTLSLPNAATGNTPDFKIIPDSRLVRAPGSAGFDIGAFIAQQAGYIRLATDEVTTRTANGANIVQTLNSTQIVERVALEYSLDPRLLLILMEFRAGWLSNPQPREDLLAHPLISEVVAEGVDLAGFYKQLAWAANQLNHGYYGWKYRNLNIISLSDGTRKLIAADLNAGSVALQYFFALTETFDAKWLFEVTENGFYRTYTAYFGDPFQDAVEPLIPASLTQPTLALPFEPGVIWRHTGGPHGGWGPGSAWASLDFAPPENSEPSGVRCYISDAWVTAVAPGVIARSAGGVVILDLDGDNDESTGWTLMYLHIAADNRVAAGSRVNTGDRIGQASCAGGVSTATHIHIARRFNGEWIPTTCQPCTSLSKPAFVMSAWQPFGLLGQEYQGYLEKGEQRVYAEEGRETTVNRISR